MNVVGFVQPFAVSVYTYVTETGNAVVFISVSLMPFEPEPAGLLIPATVALVHVKVVPVTGPDKVVTGAVAPAQ